MKPTISFKQAWSRSYLSTGGAESVYLLIEAKGNEGENAKDRAPINLSLVLDRSGCMSGAPLEYSKQACQLVTEQMDVNDLLSLVAFDDEVKMVFPPSKVTHKDLIKQRIQTIEPGGNITMAQRQIVKHAIDCMIYVHCRRLAMERDLCVDGYTLFGKLLFNSKSTVHPSNDVYKS